jgi:hypothetical protein
MLAQKQEEGKSYIFNLETGKIELHFDKAEYQSLSEADKKLIKSNFLFSRYSSAWVSRAKEPNLYQAKQAAAKLGFTQEQRQGERLSFAEQVERQVERAEARVDRMETHAANAERRAKNLQASFNERRKDWAWVTQPNINSSSGRSFTNQRNRIIARYEKGFEEYRKSEYFRDRAATAQATADMKKFSDPVYLDNRIKECKKNIRAMEKNIIHYEEILYSLENHTEEKPSFYYGRYTPDQISKWIEDQLERIEATIDKQAYMENCLEEIGGNRFSKDNIKPGYIVKIQRWGNVEVTGTGPINFTYKHDLGPNHKDWPGQVAYAAILEIIEAKEPRKDQIINPFKEGDIVCAHRPADNSIYKAYQVIKVTKTGVKIQQIAIENGKPVQGKFTGEKAKQKKIIKCKWSDWIGIYNDDWQLHKYTV